MPSFESPQCRQYALWAVKGKYTVIFVALSAGVLETLRAGLSGRTSRATRPAIAATLTEGLVLWTNGNRYPLTRLADQLGTEHGEVSDIFLPTWLARHIPTISATIFGFGLGRLIEASSVRPGRVSPMAQTLRPDLSVQFLAKDTGRCGIDLCPSWTRCG